MANVETIVNDNDDGETTVGGDTVSDDQCKAMLAKWDAENPDPKTDDDDSLSTADEGGDGYDFDLEKFRRDVNPKDNELDHVLLGTTDLDWAVDEFEKVTGMKPVMVTSLNGCGTKSARLAFESCVFIEIVAPDPKQTCSSDLKESLAKLPAEKMVPLGYAIRHNKAVDMKTESFTPMGFSCDQVTMVAQDRGMPWKWDMVFLEGHDDGGLVPFFTAWGDAHHAAGRLPILGKLDSVKVRAPAEHKIHELLEGVRDISVDSGDEYFEFTFTSATGSHTFSGSSLIGVSFPKEGGLPVNKGSL